VPFDEHMETSNREVLLVMHVENVWAVENIESMLEVPGIDVIFCGPYDLSQSMGIPGQTGSDAVMGAMRKVFRACDARGVTSGVFVQKPEQAKFWFDMGVKYLACQVDVSIYAKAMTEYASVMNNSIKS
jgi:4-hydroxy-2-oxoheptanedioate aldolase